jgi:hypothetical protein
MVDVIRNAPPPPPPPPPPKPKKAAPAVAAAGKAALGAGDGAKVTGNQGSKSTMEMSNTVASGQSKPQVSPRTADQARAEADREVFFKDSSTHEDGFRTIERDAVDVNDSTYGDVDKQIKKNEGLEKQAREQLSPTERQQYDRVTEQTKNDPEARLSLQLLAIEGKLPGEGSDAQGGNLLTNLDKMATQPLAEGIDRGALVSDFVQEVATPSAIAQHGKSTCTMTSVQIKMATENPAEYARIVGGLSTPEGKVEMASGDTLTRESGTEKDDGSGRSISARLWQPALMEYANGDEKYDNMGGKDDTGESTNERWGPIPDSHHSGLEGDQVNRAMEGLNGADVHMSDDNDDNNLDEIKEATDDGTLVPVGLNWEDGGHKVLVTKVTDDKVYIDNPWGQEESIDRDEFQDRMDGKEYHVADFGHLD